MRKSYIVAFTIFPKYSGSFYTKFEVFTSYKMAFNFYKRLQTDNKCFYESVDLNENNIKNKI